MPKRRRRKGRKHQKQAQTQQSHTKTNQQNLIDIQNQTIIIYNAGDKNVNGVYQHKCLEQDYFEKIGSIQSYKHSNINAQKTDNDANKIQHKNKNDDNKDKPQQMEESKQPQNDEDKDKDKDKDKEIIKESEKQQIKPSQVTKQKAAKYEIDRHEYLKNPEDIPDATLNKSGVWIISRVDIYPKQLLYAVNCPFKHKIKMNGWIVLKHGIAPPPKIKLFETKQVTDNDDKDKDKKMKRKKGKKTTYNIRDRIKEIQNEHHNESGNKLNEMQLKAMKKKSKMKKYDDRLMIVSGGQTGVDRAALDVAKQLNISYNGWIPKGRKAEDGVIDMEKYGNLKECDSEKYEVRTLLNVVDSDATLILNMGKLDGATLMTKKYVSQKNKDLMYITLFETKKKEKDGDEEKKTNDNDENDDNDDNNNSDDDEDDYSATLGFSDGRAQRVSEWIRCRNIKVLNIAGPRESKRTGIYAESVKFLTNVLRHFENGDIPKNSLFFSIQ